MKKKLHLGCGNRFLPGYLHIDIDNLSHLDYLAPMHELTMFEDESIDEIYNCGALIYYDRLEVVKVLKEWKRILKPGSVLRISVPNFEAIVERYLNSNKDLDSQGILGPLFGRWEARGTYEEHLKEEVIYQKTTYDFNSLKKVLVRGGFREIGKYDWKKFLPDWYDDYSRAYHPHMNEEGTLMALNVVCVK